ncbi:hypothetical protein CPT_MarsHill_051 [Staphylococcus phage MarsHill]|nr:hypothetical protein CPT_MarsHill_051 [Staphylococcus phage MarsHill]QQO92707.1 hypothetical protein CPT_Madawaska_050 [Staphylococcus phage Madawaska]
MAIVETYESMYDEKGRRIENLFWLIINMQDIDEEGYFSGYSINNMNDSTQETIIFIVDHNIREQMEKLKVETIDSKPRLVEKPGQTFNKKEEPEETPEEKEIRELQEKLAALLAGRK